MAIWICHTRDLYICNREHIPKGVNDMEKIQRLELEISSKLDWSTKALDDSFGGLVPQDFVNIYELCDLYMDIGIDADDAFAKLSELTGLDLAPQFNLSPTYGTNLLGLYATIGGFIASDREYNSLTPDERFRSEQVADAFLEVQQEVRKSTELQQKLRDDLRKLLGDKQ